MAYDIKELKRKLSFMNEAGAILSVIEKNGSRLFDEVPHVLVPVRATDRAWWLMWMPQWHNESDRPLHVAKIVGVDVDDENDDHWFIVDLQDGGRGHTIRLEVILEVTEPDLCKERQRWLKYVKDHPEIFDELDERAIEIGKRLAGDDK